MPEEPDFAPEALTESGWAPPIATVAAHPLPFAPFEDSVLEYESAFLLHFLYRKTTLVSRNHLLA